MADQLAVDIRAFGPTPEEVEELGRRLLEHPALRAVTKRSRLRLFSVDFTEPEAKRQRPTRADRFRATVYDYSGQRTLLLHGRLSAPEELEVEESGIQPIPNADELAEAVRILQSDERARDRLRGGELAPYLAMPPLVDDEAVDGPGARVLAVGLMPTGADLRGHEIVGVDMGRRTVRRFEANAPGRAAAHNPVCGPPNAGQPSVGKGVPGQVWVTVSQGNTVLWRFLAVRPSASSGTNGSGVELRYVDYKGKRVMYRGHVPILNVSYKGNACGPYLDWQYEEGMIQATGVDVAPGFRLCPTPAQTILDTGSDVGNFAGVAIYVDGLEVVLVSEMHAGWYRYVSEWRLHADGTIRPRFGFAAVANSCVCTAHYHHPYWRFDLDIGTPSGNRVREFNDPPLIGSSKWRTRRYEGQRARNPGRKRRWRVQNVDTGDAYDVVPGHDDGLASASPDWPFPQGDVWFTRYRGSEIDTGVVATGPPFEANIGTFVNSESLDGRDVVVWYGAHVVHDVSAEGPGHHGHVVGPDLRPASW